MGGGRAIAQPCQHVMFAHAHPHDFWLLLQVATEAQASWGFLIPVPALGMKREHFQLGFKGINSQMELGSLAI